ncbi:hypothetical protein AB1N83_004453 [Pleurotus pulmonarius]
MTHSRIRETLCASALGCALQPPTKHFQAYIRNANPLWILQLVSPIQSTLLGAGYLRISTSHILLSSNSNS